MSNTIYNPFGTGAWTYGERFHRSTQHWDYAHYLGPCPACGTVCFDYGGGWRCMAGDCGNGVGNPAPDLGPRPAWWNTNVQVKKDGSAWHATEEGNSATGDTPQNAVDNLKLVNA